MSDACARSAFRPFRAMSIRTMFFISLPSGGNRILLLFLTQAGEMAIYKQYRAVQEIRSQPSGPQVVVISIGGNGEY